MNAIENTVGGTYREGRIVLDRPVKWPEGTRVVVEVLEGRVGLIDGVWPADGSPDGEAEILRRMKEFEPVEFPAEGETEITAPRRKGKRGNTNASHKKKTGS
jgi:hypothetical protein